MYILKNPIYTGKYIYARLRDLNPGEDSFVVEKRYPALMSRKDFDNVQSLIKKRSPRNSNPRRITSNYLLSGLAYCDQCSDALQGGSAKSGQYRYYGCYNHLRKGKPVCDAKMINAEKLEKATLKQLKE